MKCTVLSLSCAVLLAGFSAAALANQDPVANAGPDQTVNATANCVASVTLDGTASTDPDGNPLTYTWAGGFSEGNGITTGAQPVVTLAPGVHAILLVVNDGNGGLATDTVQITVVNTTPPVISSVTATPSVLWPPNHKYVSVTVSDMVVNACDPNPVCKIISVTSNEESLKGMPLFTITGNLTVDLLAERLGKGSGREYTITIQCTDKNGNSATSTVIVTVPHDQGHGHRGK